MKNLLRIPYRLPFAEHYNVFDKGFYIDFPKQLELMGRWLQENDCKTTLDIGAITGGCIEYISKSGIRMDGVQFTADLKRIAMNRLRKSGINSHIYVSGIDEELQVPNGKRYDGIVNLGWFNLPFGHSYIRRYLAKIYGLLRPNGIFVFDFFEFGNVVIAPLELVRISQDIQYVSYSELLGKTLRKYHFWIMNHKDIECEISDLVDRDFDEVKTLLKESGLMMVKSIFMDLNYPRHFCLARRF